MRTAGYAPDESHWRWESQTFVELTSARYGQNIAVSTGPYADTPTAAPTGDFSFWEGLTVLKQSYHNPSQNLTKKPFRTGDVVQLSADLSESVSFLTCL